MTIQGFDIDEPIDEVKAKFGYTDIVHRVVDGQVTEVPNPQTIEEYLHDWLIGHVQNKLEEKPCQC